jgi:hypothetical protein
MAKGKAIGRFEVAIGLIGIIALSISVMLITHWSPLPALANWINRVQAVTDPPPLWSKRIGARPEYASVTAGGQLIVVMRGSVEAYDVRDGGLLWRHDADWAVVAGDIVVMGMDGHGYSVVDPASGGVAWDSPKANAVWAYDDMLVELTCESSDSCVLRARAHDAGGTTLWTVNVPGNGRSLAHGNPSLLGTRDPAGWFGPALQADLGPSPSVIGLPIQRKIQLISLNDGRRLRDATPPDTLSRYVVAGGQLLSSRAVPGNSSCRFTAESFTSDTNQSVWQRDGYDLGSASGAGCEQRQDPVGAGGVLVAVRGDNRPVLLNAVTGAEVWVGTYGERVLATDGALAVIGEPDNKSVRLLDLFDNAREVTVLSPGPKPVAALTPYYLVILEQSTGKLWAYTREGRLLADPVTSKGDVIGYGPNGLVIANGRTIGYWRLQ